jgi:UDP-glucose 4-epimerase
MRILITGGNGYIAKSLYNSLKNKHDITCITRQDLDLTSFKEMNKFFRDKYFDVVIHCAVQGGSRLRLDSYKDMDVNLVMYYNLLQHKSHYNKLIHFGSGAELYNSESPYGLSKRIITKSILETDNFYNIRIFGVFDENELNTRFIKNNIKRYINKESIEIHQDKLMDFFYMEDLVKLVKHYINEEYLPKNIDCSYYPKHSLLDIANIINDLSDYKVSIKQLDSIKGISYIGETYIDLSYVGLEQGIKETYKKILSEKN